MPREKRPKQVLVLLPLFNNTQAVSDRIVLLLLVLLYSSARCRTLTFAPKPRNNTSLNTSCSHHTSLPRQLSSPTSQTLHTHRKTLATYKSTYGLLLAHWVGPGVFKRAQFSVFPQTGAPWISRAGSSHQEWASTRTQ